MITITQHLYVSTQLSQLVKIDEVPASSSTIMPATSRWNQTVRTFRQGSYTSPFPFIKLAVWSECFLLTNQHWQISFPLRALSSLKLCSEGYGCHPIPANEWPACCCCCHTHSLEQLVCSSRLVDRRTTTKKWMDACSSDWTNWRSVLEFLDSAWAFSCSACLSRH